MEHQEQDKSVSASEISQDLIEIGILYSHDETSVHTVEESSTREKLSAQIALNDEAIDFIGSADAIKDIWSVPFESADTEISVAIHNIAGTLLVDRCLTHKSTKNVVHSKSNQSSIEYGDSTPLISGGVTASQSDIILSYLGSAQSTDKPFHIDSKPIDTVESMQLSEKIFSSEYNLSERNIHEYQNPPNKTNIDPKNPRQFIPWNFSGLNMIVGSDSIIIPDECMRKDRLVLWLANSIELRAQLRAHEIATHSSLSETNKEPDDKNFINCADIDNANQEIGQSQMELQPCLITTPMSRTVDNQLRKLEYEMNLKSRTQHEEGVHDRYSNGKVLSSSAIVTVLDAYLDTIIANVPQLALCLHDKGFIQSIQVLDVHELPNLTSFHLDGFSQDSNSQPLFSPDVVETNATMLLNFLKQKCSQDHSTYLLRKQAGETTLHLYDVSTLSRQRKQQWLWWLAMTSYRFALRLRQLSEGIDKKGNLCTLRSLRSRQRNLLKNALELLEEHIDMGGQENKTITAAVYECLADTYLTSDDSKANEPMAFKNMSNESIRTKSKASSSFSFGTYSKFLLTPTLSSQESYSLLPYRFLKTDCLTKAQDNLIKAIDSLKSMCEKKSTDSNQSEFLKDEFLFSRLNGLTHKLINVLLQVTSHYFHNYSTSDAMQSLRMAGRRISDSLDIMKMFGHTSVDQEHEYVIKLFFQTLSLWEHCGIFARSYAVDSLWRDRGHAGGDDIIALLQDVQNTLTAVDSTLAHYSSKDVVGSLYDFNLNNLTGIIETANVSNDKENAYLSTTTIAAAKQILDRQKQIKREENRVTVAATRCFGRAVWILAALDVCRERAKASLGKMDLSFQSSSLDASSHIRQLYGDACNELGNILLAKVKDLLLSSSVSRITLHDSDAAPYAPLLVSAEIWFMESLTQFQICNDQRNMAVIRCNLCQCNKLRSNMAISLPRSTSCLSFKHERFSRDNHSELCLQDAINHLQLAHLALDQRELDSKTWDMVSEELAASYLLLGVKRRQTIIGGGMKAVMPIDIRIQPGEERFIIEPMQQAIIIYEQLGNQFQVAAAHYQLAIFYSKVWSSQVIEGKMREKLEKAFGHFQHAHTYFFNHMLGNEPTFVILCIDLSHLYSSVSSEATCLIKALLCCIDACNAFAPTWLANQSLHQDDWIDKMKTLSKRTEETIFSLLARLVKLEKVIANGDEMSRFRNIYRKLLALKMGLEMNEYEEFPVYKILLQLRDEMKPYTNNQQK